MTDLIVKAVSKIAIPEPSMSDGSFEILKGTLQDGDCLVSRREWELSNFFEYALTGSFYGHAAIYLDGHVYEAVTGGVRKVSLERFCFTKDFVGVCRLPGSDWTEGQVKMMRYFCDDQIGERYDYGFNWDRQDRWYCSKLVWSAWHVAMPIEAEAVKINYLLGQKKVIPQDIWESTVQVLK